MTTHRGLYEPYKPIGQTPVEERRPRALLSFWLHPRATLTDLAVGSAWSWITPIGLALLVFYARIFALAYLHDPRLYQALAGGAVGVLVGWPVYTALLFALIRLTGGRSDFRMLLVLCAWATLPLTLRGGLQVFYMLGAGRLAAQPGLAGLLVGMDSADWGVRMAQLLLGWVDIFVLWRLGLLVLAVSIGARISLTKALALVILSTALILLLASSLVVT